MTHSFDALILGGGAAGLMCAIEAGKRGRRVAVLEHADRLGKKILISGGGRCNFTNLHCRPEIFSPPIRTSPSQLWPATLPPISSRSSKNTASPITKKLWASFSATAPPATSSPCSKPNAAMPASPSFSIRNIQQVAANDRVHRSFENAESEDAEFRAPALVVATGGLSIPKIGATSFGYDLARQFGLAIREPWPGLVPLTLHAEDCSRYCDLAGVSTEVIASAITPHGSQQFREKMLITHRGLSGPAILQISSYWKKPQPILIDLAPGREITAAFRDPKTPRNLSTLRTELRKFLPHRLADRWLDLHAPTSWTNQALADLEKQAHAWAISPSGTEGYEKAEVTAGGVDTDELSRQNHGEPQSSRPVFHRRSRRRHRPSRRLQFPMGLVVRRRRRPGALSYAHLAEVIT